MFALNNQLLILLTLDNNVCISCLYNKLLVFLLKDCAKLVLNN